MYLIKLSDDSVLPVRFCGARGGTLTMSVLSALSFLEIAAIFADADKTGRIEFIYGDMSDVHEGYTDLRVINGAAEGEYIITLRKGEKNT